MPNPARKKPVKKDENTVNLTLKPKAANGKKKSIAKKPATKPMKQTSVKAPKKAIAKTTQKKKRTSKA